MQIIIILKTFKDVFACKIVFDVNHHYPENIHRHFRLQNCLRRKSSLSWNYSKTFLPAKLSSPQIIIFLKIFKDLFACKIVLAANNQYLGNIQKLFACKIVLAANRHYPEIIQRLFRLQNCLRRKSSLSWKHWKTFRLQNCLSRKSSLSWKHSKTFSPAKLSSTQIIIILKIFKNFFARKNFLDANHQNPENIQRLSACKDVLAANHHYHGNIQRLFRLQNCLRRKSSLSWIYPKIFSPANFS